MQALFIWVIGKSLDFLAGNTDRRLLERGWEEIDDYGVNEERYGEFLSTLTGVNYRTHVVEV